jgi:hypothetical protein
MRIAYLGWGSLVWLPGELLIRGQWFTDGPFLPIEFCRQSEDGRLTLVITSAKPELRTLWALALTDAINEAIASLQNREGLCGGKKDKNTGVWPTDARYAEAPLSIVTWAKQNTLDAVIWTALGARFAGKDDFPTEVETVKYLRELLPEKRRLAEEYIRRAPVQIDTNYRRRFELEFGWTALK